MPISTAGVFYGFQAKGYGYSYHAIEACRKKSPHENMGLMEILGKEKNSRNTENFAALLSAAYKVLRGAGAFSKAARVYPPA